mgnify:CR=1 FL=1|tara:strand:- start:726 stop:974 length:249 start_codon:yes stop_codon:yes gene_type:complete
MKFANIDKSWFNKIMKNEGINIKEKLVAKYLDSSPKKNISKGTNINVLLNRVKIKQKNESRKKIIFSAAASTGLFLFGFFIF